MRFLVPIKLLQIKFPSSFVEKKLSCFLSWKVDDLIDLIDQNDQSASQNHSDRVRLVLYKIGQVY